MPLRVVFKSFDMIIGQISFHCLARICLIAGMIVIFSGCSSHHSGNENSAVLTNSVSIGVPRILSRAVDLNLLSLKVEIDNVEQSLSVNDAGTQWSGNIPLPEGDVFLLTIEWRHANSLLARYSRQQENIVNGDELIVSSADYQTTGDEFDDDNDGISNLAELQADDEQPQVDLIIPRVSESGPPDINGAFGPIWAEHPVFDTSGDGLKINNLLLDNGADRPDGNTEFNWQAVHDDQYLYLIVYAEDTERATPNADSIVLANDDTLHVYLDGNNSKGQTYDGVDDLHIQIPFLKILRPVDPSNSVTRVLDNDGNVIRDAEGNLLVDSAGEQFYMPPHDLEPNNSRDPDGRFEGGSNSIPLPSDFEFENCLCLLGQHLYEIKINLAQAGIVVGRPFGIEIQLDDDIDGGNKDARYGWSHPSGGSQSATDNTWDSPFFMGTAILQN